MVGEVDVRRVILGPLPTAVVPAGERVEVVGRTADPTRPVAIQRSVGGGAFATVATASPAPDGSWRATMAARADRRLPRACPAATSARRGGCSSASAECACARRDAASPSRSRRPSPYARVVLQADLHERFGWWPVARARLDYLSQASFGVQRPARVRAVLVAKDGWTPLATSAVVVLGHAKPTHMGGDMHMHAAALARVSRPRD